MEWGRESSQGALGLRKEPSSPMEVIPAPGSGRGGEVPGAAAGSGVGDGCLASPVGTVLWDKCRDSCSIPSRGTGKLCRAGPQSLLHPLCPGACLYPALTGSLGWLSVDFMALFALLHTDRLLCLLLVCPMLSDPFFHFLLCLHVQWKPGCQTRASCPASRPTPTRAS